MSSRFLPAALASLSLFAIGATITPAAAADPIYTARLSNVAVGGYDPVSFFEGEGVKGSKDYSTTYMGAEFRFASAENLAKFEASPAAYAPQYGGYCAWAAAQGYLAPGDPDFATVYDGKLYLNYDGKVQERWDVDRSGFIAAANANWPQLLN